MHLQLRTLRDKKTGGTAETLDIVLSDENGGERPYETFSGGEAFRVNFALRVALSQLLARRSGVSVRTLVVDEGFGTQDPQGLQALVEAIRHVQDHFDKILVVTHLDELKEAFPVRIEVRKDPHPRLDVRGDRREGPLVVPAPPHEPDHASASAPARTGSFVCRPRRIHTSPPRSSNPPSTCTRVMGSPMRK